MSKSIPSRLAIAAIALGATLAASGCSWFQRDQARQPPGGDRPAPSVGRVPDKAPETGTTRERLAIEQGLMADRENARHIDGPIAAEERQSSLPAGREVRPQVITPGAPAPVAAEGNRRGAPAEPARPAAPRSITFVAGSSALPTGSGASIVALAEAHRRAGGGLVSVVGNAAAGEGDAAARRTLALARVQSVVDALINLGVPREAIRGGAGNVDAPRVDLGFVPRR